jgi:Ca2+-binding RTX toxin-like protein
MMTSIYLADIAAGRGGFVIHGENINDQAGFSVSHAGDVNGDGLGDLIIGARIADAAGNLKNRAGDTYVVFGQNGGWPAAIDLSQVARGQGGFVIFGEDVDDQSSVSVSAAGDVNGDGFDDLIIGADGADAAGNTKTYAGGAYLVFGRPGGFPPSIDLALVAQGQGGSVIHGADAYDYAGISVSAAGDINGDGFDDVIIGARGADGAGNGRYESGGAYVVFGRQGGFPASIDLARVEQGQGGFVIHGEDRYDFAGISVSAAGDVNGDGFDDLIIGAAAADAARNAKFLAGGAYVVFGRQGGFPASIDLAEVAQGRGGFVIHGEDVRDYAGGSVSAAGDVNGDGIDDLIIGANGADAAANAKSLAGGAYVVFGRNGVFPAAIDLARVAQGQGGFVIHGEDRDDRTGFSVSSAGDINGDGIADLIVGASFADGAGNAKRNAGDAYVVFGRENGFSAAVNLKKVAEGRGGFVIHGEDLADEAGISVSAAGDVNGDGFDDLIVGAWRADGAGNTRPDAGGAYVIFGGAFTAGSIGTSGDDLLGGGSGAQGLVGLAGDDTLRGGRGDDTVIGGEGRDRLSGGRGADVLSGGAGADRFVFNQNALGATDRILDFDAREGDRIVLRSIDANVGTPADDAFIFIGARAFSGTAGELRATAIQGGTVQRITGDVNGDGLADLTIDVVTAATASAGWFVL